MPTKMSATHQIRIMKARALERSVVVKAMAHPTRLLVIEALLDGERCVNDLNLTADCDVTTLSKHLAVMKRAGILSCEKRGLNVYYRVACPCLGDFFRCVDLISGSRGGAIRCAC